MPPETNKALIDKWLRAWAKADLGAVEGIFASTYAVNGTFVGPDGVKQAIQALHSALSTVALTCDDLIAEGDKVVVRWTIRAIHSGAFLGIPPTGKSVQLTGINIYHILGGRIVANHEQVGVWELRQQLEPGAPTGGSD